MHLSAQEEDDLITILHKIDRECQQIDKHTQEIILTQIESLLKYSNRFYERQFLTRKNNSSALLTRFEQLIGSYFNGDLQGFLTVQ